MKCRGPKCLSRIVCWGTYDLGKPRVRLLISGAKSQGLEVIQCHADVWYGLEDKSRLRGLRAWLSRFFKWLLAYPTLIRAYLKLPEHDVVLVPYLGHLDVIVLWPFSRFRRTPIAWDAFLSLYDTVVNDRRLISSRSPLAGLLYAWEWLACRAADIIFLDTEAQARYFEMTFRLSGKRVGRVFVGAEEIFFGCPDHAVIEKTTDSFTVFFYGQFIPLHGIETIIRAAHICEEAGESFRWIIAGQGQEEKRIENVIRHLNLLNIKRVPWIPFDELVQWIHKADVCLGIFGASEKAARVIPNKVFQILACGKPLITSDTPAVRELIKETPTIRLIPPGDPEQLASAVSRLARKKRAGVKMKNEENQAHLVGPHGVGKQLKMVLCESTRSN